MTEAEERREIARNAKTALQILGKYPEAKGQTK